VSTNVSTKKKVETKESGTPAIRDRKSRDARRRRQRTPFGVPMRRLSLDDATKEELNARGLVPRWVNDVEGGDRVRRALKGGYEFVPSSGYEEVGEGDELLDLDESSCISRHVGKNKSGKELKAYLMAIPKEFKDEDDKIKEATNAKVDQAIKGGAPPGSQATTMNSGQGHTLVNNVSMTSRTGGVPAQ
jgi:hypothetical protein